MLIANKLEPPDPMTVEVSWIGPRLWAVRASSALIGTFDSAGQANRAACAAAKTLPNFRLKLAGV